MNFRQVEYEALDSIHVILDTISLRAVVNTVMNLQSSLKSGVFLYQSRQWKFLMRTQFRGVTDLHALLHIIYETFSERCFSWANVDMSRLCSLKVKVINILAYVIYAPTDIDKLKP
jgi:hypothetical protein